MPTLTLVLGWRAQSDAERLCVDPLLAVASSETRSHAAAGQGLASQLTLARLVDLLTSEPNEVAHQWGSDGVRVQTFTGDQPGQPASRDHDRYRWATRERSLRAAGLSLQRSCPGTGALSPNRLL